MRRGSNQRLLSGCDIHSQTTNYFIGRLSIALRDIRMVHKIPWKAIILQIHAPPQ